jgi:ribosome-binding protein aMBF1 (putative translation factor)
MTALADLIDPAALVRLAELSDVRGTAVSADGGTDSAAESATTQTTTEECVSAAPTAARRTSSPIGGVGRNVVANVEQLRQARGLSFRALSEMLGAVGRPILPAVLHRLSQGKRRVDADDLVAFAAALGVTPRGSPAATGYGQRRSARGSPGDARGP